MGRSDATSASVIIEFSFEDDDKLLNQPLYSQTYATDGASAVHSWVLIALPTLAGCIRGALEGPTAAPLALMPPMQ